MTYHIFVGYDEREHEVFQTAKHSLLKHAKSPIEVHKLHHKELREAGLFNRTWRIDETGQYYDELDGKPFSTQFSHTRFMVPELWRNIPKEKNSLAMFVDCDFVWLNDINEMFAEIETKKRLSSGKAPVYCVQHDYKPKTTVKMDNINQSKYNMKLWSAMMVFDMDHSDMSRLTPKEVNELTGRELHTFEFLSNQHNIGTIDPSWHFVPDHSESQTSSMNAVHYTEGGPWFPKYRSCKYSRVWWDAYQDFLRDTVRSVEFDMAGLIDG